jgi:MFS family permease
MSEAASSTSPAGAWVSALVVATGMQAVLAMMARALPVLGPAVAAVAGVPAENIGYLAALSSLGTMVCLLGGAGLLRRYGPVRMLQAGAVLSGVAMLLGASGTWAAFLIASFASGFGYGPSAPAGSEILLHRAPARRRSLVFSIKQAGVPLGGVVAGILLPPIALAGGVAMALVACALLSILFAVIVQPWRREIDAESVSERAPDTRIFDLIGPFRTVFTDARLVIATFTGFSMAIAQGALFTFFVTFLDSVTDYTLSELGILFSVMQAVGVGSRIAVGWVADRIGSAWLTVAGLAFASGGAMLLLCMIGPDWSWAELFVVSAVVGFAVSSWNGVLIGEIGALAKPGKVGEATSASTFITFAGYVLSPAIVSLLVTWTGSYAAGFIFAAALPFVSGILLLLTLRGRKD